MNLLTAISCLFRLKGVHPDFAIFPSSRILETITTLIPWCLLFPEYQWGIWCNFKTPCSCSLPEAVLFSFYPSFLNININSLSWRQYNDLIPLMKTTSDDISLSTGNHDSRLVQLQLTFLFVLFCFCHCSLSLFDSFSYCCFNMFIFLSTDSFFLLCIMYSYFAQLYLFYDFLPLQQSLCQIWSQPNRGHFISLSSSGAV